MRNGRSILIVVLNILAVSSAVCPAVQAQQDKRPFTVADDIGLTLFSPPNGPKMESVLFSPDEKYFAV